MPESIVELMIMPAVTAILQALKRIPFFRLEKIKSHLPVIAMALGVILSVAVSLFLYDNDKPLRITAAYGVVHGIILGMGACGVYDICKYIGNKKGA